MSSGNLRNVLDVLQELIEILVEDAAQKRSLRQKFLRHLENEEHILLLDVKDDDDNLSVYDKIKAAKKRLEDACFFDIAGVCSNSTELYHTLNTLRKLYEKDFIQKKEELSEEIIASETSRLLATVKEKKQNWMSYAMKYIPIIGWAKRYSLRKDLRGDIFAGCTVAFMTFPQAMGYAILAGLPPIYGLYASFVPVFIYSCLGTSAEMSVGPAAMVALMIPDTLAGLAPPGSDEYILYATFLSFFSGLILFLAGLVNAGFLVENVLSVPLLTGWIQGAAILIILSQMAGFLQIHIPQTSNSLVSVITSIAENITSTNGWAVLVGGVCLFLLFSTRKLGEKKFPIIKKLPISLCVLILVTVLTRVLNWHTTIELEIIGTIPQGLPTPGFFSLSWDLIQKSVQAAFAIAIIGFMEGISLAKKFAGLRKYRIDVSQELRALGLANMFGSLFKAFPVTGSVTRTSVNYQAGSRTTFSSIINGILVGGVLLFLSPLFYYTPRTALAAIVISAGLSLIDIDEIMFLWKIKAKYDLVQLFFVFIVTLFTGPEFGAVFAILVSILQIIYRSTRPNCVTIGPVQGTSVYKTGNAFTKVTASKGILVVKLESNLYFYTIAWLKENLFNWEAESLTPVHTVILDCTGIESADSSGIHGLNELVDEYKKKNICMFFSNVKPILLDTMELSGLLNKVGTDSVFGTTHEAVEVADTLSFSQRRKMCVIVN